MAQALKFTRDKAALALIEECARRAAAMDLEANGPANSGGVLHHTMNLSACHASGNPLRLSDLLQADDFNFAHDIFGIDRHINRATGKLENFFSPRFLAREQEAA